jgi:hypothetical protein
MARIVIPPFVPYTPLLGATASPSDLHAGKAPIYSLLNTLASEYGAVSLHLQPSVSDVRAFRWDGWDVSPFYTYVVDLTAPDGPLAAWSKNNRRDYRHFKPVYEVGLDIVDSPSLIKLVSNSYARHDRALPVAASLLERLVCRLMDAGILQLFGARDTSSGSSVAVCAVLRTADRAAYWLAGSQPGPGMTVVMGALFEYLAREGVRELDMVGANTPSIAEFKRRFGSKLSVYYRAEKSTGLVFRIAKALRSIR